MISQLPESKNSQVELIRAGINLGQVLDEFNLAINSNQKTYSIVGNISSAIDFAKATISETKDIECNVYGRE